MSKCANTHGRIALKGACGFRKLPKPLANPERREVRRPFHVLRARQELLVLHKTLPGLVSTSRRIAQRLARSCGSHLLAVLGGWQVCSVEKCSQLQRVPMQQTPLQRIQRTTENLHPFALEMTDLKTSSPKQGFIQNIIEDPNTVGGNISSCSSAARRTANAKQRASCAGPHFLSCLETRFLNAFYLTRYVIRLFFSSVWLQESLVGGTASVAEAKPLEALQRKHLLKRIQAAWLGMKLPVDQSSRPHACGDVWKCMFLLPIA